MNNDIITINKAAIILLKKGSEIVLTVDAKKELEKILYVRDLIEKVYTSVQDKLTIYSLLTLLLCVQDPIG